MVSSISSENNANAKTSTGKWVGAASGAGVAGYMWNKTNKYNKKVDEFLSSKEVQDAIESKNVGEFKTLLNNSKLDKNPKNGLKLWTSAYEKNPDSFKKFFKKYGEAVKNKSIVSKSIISAITVLIGLGIGAFVDSIINKN